MWGLITRAHIWCAFGFVLKTRCYNKGSNWNLQENEEAICSYLFIVCVNCFKLGVILHHCCFLLGESFPHNSESDIVPLTFPAALFFFLDSCSVITSRFYVLTVRRFLIITYSMHLTHTRRLDSNDRWLTLAVEVCGSSSIWSLPLCPALRVQVAWAGSLNYIHIQYNCISSKYKLDYAKCAISLFLFCNLFIIEI